MRLAYEALTASGQQITGTIDAVDSAEATDKLYADGIYVTSMSASAAAETPEAEPGGRHKLKDLVAFTRQLAILVSTGTTLVESLGAIERQIDTPGWKATVVDVRRRVEQGESLVQALREHPRHFSAVYCSLVAAGESGGRLPTMLDRLANMTRQQIKMRHTVMSAMTYPLLLVSISFVVVIVMLTAVLPRFAELFESLDAGIPATTQILLDLGVLLRSYWWAAIGIACLPGIGGLIAWRSENARRAGASLLLNLPMIGRLTRSLAVASLVRTLGTLLESRVPMLEALELTAGSMRNWRYKELIEQVMSSVSRGESITSVLRASDLIDPATTEAIQTGERSGRVGAVLFTLADSMDEDNELVVKSLTSILEPTILIVLGLVVGFVAVSMFMPLFDLTSLTTG